MKFNAFIILISVLVYATEQVKIPLIISKPQKVSCCKEKLKCHKKMSDKPSGSCEENSCLNCPLTTTFVIVPINITTTIVSQFTNEFVPLKTKLVSGFYCKVWRPPVVS